MDHGITWDQVRTGTVAELREGVTFISPGVGTAYQMANGSIRGVGWLPLDGTAWTVRSMDSGKITATSHDGREVTQPLPKRTTTPILIKR